MPYTSTKWPPLAHFAPVPYRENWTPLANPAQSQIALPVVTPKAVVFQPAAPPVPPPPAVAALNTPTSPPPLIQTPSGLSEKRTYVTVQNATWTLFGIINGTNAGI